MKDCDCKDFNNEFTYANEYIYLEDDVKPYSLFFCLTPMREHIYVYFRYRRSFVIQKDFELYGILNDIYCAECKNTLLSGDQLSDIYELIQLGNSKSLFLYLTQIGFTNLPDLENYYLLHNPK